MSVLIIGKGSIEEKVKAEKEQRAQQRRDEDVRSGLSISKGAQRGDFKQCVRLDRVLGDYRRFKSPEDRAKIVREYEGLQREMRKGTVRI